MMCLLKVYGNGNLILLNLLEEKLWGYTPEFLKFVSWISSIITLRVKMKLSSIIKLKKTYSWCSFK